MSDASASRLLLEGAGLTKRYGGVVAVDDVALRLHAGEVLGLVGPNGAGKTTLVDLISGAQASDGGSLVLDGQPLTGSAPRRARLGLARTFQYPQLALSLSIRDNLLVGQVASRNATVPRMIANVVRGIVFARSNADDEVVDRLAVELRIPEPGRLARDLTLGEQRLVEVGRALANEPTVLLLDEPFAGSDANGIDGIIEAIRTVRQRGHGVILVDHNVDLVASVVDRVMLLDQGRVLFDGDPQECLASAEMQTVYFGVSGADHGS